MVRITDFNINWKKIKSACMTTISKEAGDKELSSEWKRKLLLCEHSPIRRGTISWKFDEIPYCISTHFVRHHEGVEKWVSTCADPLTRKYWQAVLEAIKEYDEDIYWSCVPECVRCGGCPEYKPCGFYDILMKDATIEEQKVLKLRYDRYNQFRSK